MSDPTLVLVKAVALSFVRGFLAVFVTLVIGLLSAPNFSLEKSAVISLIAASLAGGLRAVQALLTNAEPTDQAVN